MPAGGLKIFFYGYFTLSASFNQVSCVKISDSDMECMNFTIS